MSILFWLLPALVVTCAASAWAAWVGRTRPELREQSDEAQSQAQRRMAEAIAKPNVGSGQRPERVRDRSTGVAVRRR